MPEQPLAAADDVLTDLESIAATLADARDYIGGLQMGFPAVDMRLLANQLDLAYGLAEQAREEVASVAGEPQEVTVDTLLEAVSGQVREAMEAGAETITVVLQRA